MTVTLNLRLFRSTVVGHVKAPCQASCKAMQAKVQYCAQGTISRAVRGSNGFLHGLLHVDKQKHEETFA